MTREILCILCPNGCRLTAETTGDNFDNDFTVTGGQCSRGAGFARAEITNPVRGLTTTVRTTLPGIPALPVKISGEIPKGKIREAARFIKTITVTRPLGIGEAAAENILGLGVDVIITSDIMNSILTKSCAVFHPERQLPPQSESTSE